MRYKLPNQFIHEFLEVGGKNYSTKEDGTRLETMAFLLGHEELDEIIATHLVFPDQEGFASHVDDKGKNKLKSLLMNCLY